ncbi:Dual-specificity kinase, spindle pole body (SPB) duplication and spindle checkpoint function [Tieghemiomyces parasiticus]|uniref:Dual-specificity kinase, spindle pole body (SPB) duplication and spindle checkpoint function n=1 Tax=Tieghemiomyces parasiticus TaxID=78921 RepID=A0A9W8DYW8_9FUNG|nr:Dual-specificity kinase, spindle pole body (SPB) duplication and spindle checkpoint function [Tieghemiomyces parasiticus]
MADPASLATPVAARPVDSRTAPNATATTHKSGRWKRGRIGLGPPVRTMTIGDHTDTNPEDADEALGLTRTESDDLGLDLRLDEPISAPVRRPAVSPVSDLRHQLNAVVVRHPSSTPIEDTSVPTATRRGVTFQPSSVSPVPAAPSPPAAAIYHTPHTAGGPATELSDRPPVYGAAAITPKSVGATSPAPPTPPPAPVVRPVPPAPVSPRSPPLTRPPVLPPPADRRYVHVNGRPYTRLEVIGRGGSSKVYKVMSADNRLYAIKKVALAKADPITVQGYINEIELLKRLHRSDHIIRLIDAEVNFERGSILIILECGEIDLAHILLKHQDKPLNLNFVRMYWEQMLEAVHAIHEQKIVHSDLKPANFLLVAGSLKLIDFGIAKTIANDTTNIHREHQIGTVNYMSPEAIEDTNAAQPGGRRCMKLGRPSDVWSLGCILYQMVYGRTPFAHLKNIYTKLRAIPDPNVTISFPITMTAGDEAATLTIPAELLAVVRSCLQRDSRTRPTIPELLQHPFLRQASLLTASQRELLQHPPLDPDNLKYVVRQVLQIVTDNPDMLHRNGGARDRDVDRVAAVLWRAFTQPR